MPHERWHFTLRTVLKAIVLVMAFGVVASCDEEQGVPPPPGVSVTIGSFHIVGQGMYQAFMRWRTSLTGKEREVLEELIEREDLLIHVFLATGRLSPVDSRGGASAPASTADMKQTCDFHPIVGRFAWERDWDVAYDPERTKWFEDTHGIPTPPEVVLHHEIFGHVIPALMNPELIPMSKDVLFKKTKECEALDVENRYRTQIKYPHVSRKLMKCPSP